MDTREWPASCSSSCLVSSLPGSSHANSWKRGRCACPLGNRIFIWEHPEPRMPVAFISPALRKKVIALINWMQQRPATVRNYTEAFIIQCAMSQPLQNRRCAPTMAQDLPLATSYWSRGWQRCALCLCRWTSAWTPLRNRLGNGCHCCRPGPSPGPPLSWAPQVVSQAGRKLKCAGWPEAPSSCTSLEVIVRKAVCPLWWGVTPAVHHLCEHLEKLLLHPPGELLAGGLACQDVAASWVRPDEPHSWQKNVTCLPGLRGSLWAGSALHWLHGWCIAPSATWQMSRRCGMPLLFSYRWGPSGVVEGWCQAWCVLRRLAGWTTRLYLGYQLCSVAAVSSLGRGRVW